MGEGKQAIDSSKKLEDEDVSAQIKAKYKELVVSFEGWVAKQSWHVETAVVTITSSIKGAAIGGLIGTLTHQVPSPLHSPPSWAAGLSPRALDSLHLAQALMAKPLIQARNFAILTGLNAGITCGMKRLRGKLDVQASMVAAFGSGAMFSMVSGMGGPTKAVTFGLFFALVQGGVFKIEEKCSQPPVEDVYYSKTRNLLASLGLQQYEENFKKGLLNDSTLPLLTDSALQDVRIPPGPRLVILDRVKRDLEK